MSRVTQPKVRENSPEKRFSLFKIPLWLIIGLDIVVAVVLLALVSSLVLILPVNTTSGEAKSSPLQMLPQIIAKPIALNIQQSPQENPVAASRPGDGGTTGDLNPVVQGMGGTCITGKIIDVYDNPTGDKQWEVIVTPLTPQAGEPVKQTVSKVGEIPKFPATGKLGAGTYRVEIKPPEGWTPYTPDVIEVTLDGKDTNTSCAEVRFKMVALACLEVTKVDLGYGEPYEAGIPDWEITAALGDTVLKQKTDGVGKTIFKNLTPGTWTISEETKTGWIAANGYPSKIDVVIPTPVQPGRCFQVKFANNQIHDSCIAVKKVDEQDQPLAGWEIKLTRKDGTRAPINRVTGLDGLAYFEDLPLGEWIVDELPKTGWAPVGTVTQTVNLTSPAPDCRLITIKNQPLGCVDGYKINSFDQGMGSWEIQARNAGTGASFKTTTDSTGYFRFDQLTYGVWTITETLQDGWTAVTASELTVDVNQSLTCSTIRFKNRTDYACLDVWKVDSYDNFGIAGWEVNLQPAYGGQQTTGITDGTGWVRFNQLTPGIYNVWETPKAGWASNGPTTHQVELQATGQCEVMKFYNYQTNKPAPPPVEPGGTSPVTVGCSAVHVVKAGNTLFGIAQQYGVTLQALRDANRLQNTNIIHPGDKLCIPAKR